MSAIARNCTSCGTDLPVGARFCASCGARSGPVEGPVTWSVAEKRVFGVVPGATALEFVRTRGGRLLALVRSRTRLAVAVVESRIAAWTAKLRLKWDLRNLAHERTRTLQALGEAVYRDERDESGRIKMQIVGLERRMEELNVELRHVDRREHERIAYARMEGGPTSIVEPEPPIVPEPAPVPHEPPGPVIVPEPEPIPHEPPGPVIVPEPDPRQPPDD